MLGTVECGHRHGLRQAGGRTAIDRALTGTSRVAQMRSQAHYGKRVPMTPEGGLRNTPVELPLKERHCPSRGSQGLYAGGRRSRGGPLPPLRREDRPTGGRGIGHERQNSLDDERPVHRRPRRRDHPEPRDVTGSRSRRCATSRGLSPSARAGSALLRSRACPDSCRHVRPR